MVSVRNVNPKDIVLPSRYQIDVFAEGLNVPINLVFTEHGEMLLADAGVTDGNGKVLRYQSGGFSVVADGFTPPLTGINYKDGRIYVSHRGKITVVKQDGSREDVLVGLPSWGDHHNNQVVFGPDGKMYFGQGTATNSGIVGDDNSWVGNYPYFHDYPGISVRLTGENFATKNAFAPVANEEARTGAFLPFGIPSQRGERIKGITAVTGGILRANPDGSHLEMVAWGLRNPFRLRFDRKNRLFATSHGMDERGSRPVANSPDEFHEIKPGTWYGWPDFTGGRPVTLPEFRSHGKPQPRFLLQEHPMTPPKPIAAYPPHSAVMGFDFNYDPQFGPIGDVFVAEFGQGSPRTAQGKALPWVGHQVSRIDGKTGVLTRFARNRSGQAATDTGEGGFERPIDVSFGTTGEMYVVDMGLNAGPGEFHPNTGVIWRVTRRTS